MEASLYFNTRQLNTVRRIGDILAPAGSGFPAFSATGALAYIDEIMAAAHPDDIRDFARVLGVLHYLPDAVLRRLLQKCMAAHGKSGAVYPLLRQLDIALRGVVYSLYYAGLHHDRCKETVHGALQYTVHCTADAA